MKNEYVHLENNITMIYCTTADGKVNKEIFIDTEDFERVSEFDGEWKLFTDAGTGKENDYVVQVSEGGGKYTTLHLFLKDVPNDKQKYTRRANGNKLDLRKENLMILNKGEGNMSETKRKAQEIAQQLPTISMKERIEKNSLKPPIKILKDLYTNEIIIYYGERQATFDSMTEKDAKKLLQLFI